MSKFQGMGKADIGGQSGSYIEVDGKFEIEVKRAFFMTSRKKQDMVMIEFIVQKSNTDAVKVGSKYSHAILTSWVDSFLEKCKAFFAAAGLGIDPSSGDVDDIEKLRDFVSSCGVETVKVGAGKKAVEMPTADCDDLDTLWEHAAEAATNDDEDAGTVNPLEGVKLLLETVCTPKKNKPSENFTNHYWTPIG
jgi:hypothetical protein